MENNKPYLEKIHWILLTGFLTSLFNVYAQPWLYRFFGWDSIVPFIISTILGVSLLFAALGIATSKWKEALISGVATLVISAIYLLPASLSSYKLLLSFFLSPLSLILFIGLQSGWKLKLLGIYVTLLCMSIGFALTFYTSQQAGQAIRHIFDDGSRTLYTDLFSVYLGSAYFVFRIIYLCEATIYAVKRYPEKPTSLNLGNQYEKLNSFITFWAMKTMILVLLIGTLKLVPEYTDTFRQRFDKAAGTYFKYTSVFAMLGIAAITIFLAWYLRKFLLEYFITFNIRSKFLYWFSLLPVIGLFVFLILQADNKKQESYNEKRDSLGAFANSSSTSITVIFLVLLLLRMLFGLAQGDSSVVISIIVSGLLFAWLISDKSGYYFNIGIVGVALLAVMGISLYMGYANEVLMTIIPALLLNLIYLVLLFPIYHIGEFEYIPGENPDPAPHEQTDLFGTIT